MSNSNIFRILSPLLLFVAHLAYLIVLSPDPFLKKWIDGSFTFFVTLVMCNLIRARIAARAEQHEQPDDPTADQDSPNDHATP